MHKIWLIIAIKEIFMKKLNKAILGVTALVMAFSVSAMAACSNTDNDPNSPKNPNSPNYVQPVKNNDVKKTIEAFGKQNFKAVSLDYTYEDTYVSSDYECNASGVKLENATVDKYSNHYKMTVSEKMNFKTLDMDMTSYDISEELDKDGKPVAEGTRKEYDYTFMRGGKMYGKSSQTEITDFSNVEFDYSYDAEIPPQVTAILAALPEEGMSAEFMTPVTAIMRLGDIYGGATYANNKLTVNFNKVAYKLYNEVLEVIEGLNDETKVGDLIKKTPVKNLLQSLTYGIDAKEIYDQVVAMAGGENADATVKAQIDKLPKPAEKETVYAYLLKLLESKDVAELIFSMAAPGMPASAIAPIADFKVSEIITLVMGIVGGNGGVATQAEASTAPTMAQIKTMVKGLINKYLTVTEDKITVNAGNKTEVSAAEVVFNVGDDYTVSSISLSVDIKMTYSSIENHNDSYHKYEGTGNMKFTASAALSKTEYTLKTINTTVAE